MNDRRGLTLGLILLSVFMAGVTSGVVVAHIVHPTDAVAPWNGGTSRPMEGPDLRESPPAYYVLASGPHHRVLT